LRRSATTSIVLTTLGAALVVLGMLSLAAG
jgi:hypothetical protein